MPHFRTLTRLWHGNERAFSWLAVATAALVLLRLS